MVWAAPESELQAWWAKGHWISKKLQTLQGDTIRLVQNGTFNSGEGPDFFNAAIHHQELLLLGDIEIHNKASDWFHHGHQNHRLYQNLLLHVVWVWDLPHPPVGLPYVIELSTQNTLKAPQPRISEKYAPEFNPLCVHRLNEVPNEVIALTLNLQWALRIQTKWNQIISQSGPYASPDELVYFSLMRAIGMPYNTEPMEWLAKQLPWEEILKVKAAKSGLLPYFLGLSDYLEPTSGFKAVFSLWAFQNRKSSLLPIPFKKGNSRRAVQPKALLSLASKFWEKFQSPSSSLLEVNPDEALWQMTKIKGLGKERAMVLYMNGIAPLVYGIKGINALKELQAWPLENNRYTRHWLKAGMPLSHLPDGQAALQLYRKECAGFRCLQCPIGQFLLNR